MKARTRRPAGGRKWHGHACRHACTLAFVCLVMPPVHGSAAAEEKFRSIPHTLILTGSREGDPATSAANAFRGAVELRWKRKRFGGFSGLHVTPTGKRFTAISDHGAWLEADLVYEAGRLVGARKAEFKRLRGLHGKKLKRGDDDAEALSPDGAGGFVVAFERRHLMLRYPAWRRPFFLRPSQMAVPPDLQTFSENHGVEALTRLCDGRYLAITERGAEKDKEGEGGTGDGAWLGNDGTWAPLPIERSPEFRISGAATLSDCSVALLERGRQSSDRWVTRVRRLQTKEVSARTGSPLKGTVVLGPFPSGAKFEGVAAHPMGQHKEMLLLIADNDFERATVMAVFAINHQHWR